ncbi:MAG: GNAT family N-acetyltransferase [Planctomycetes bacterium]|nr:GNAT family N-acetyltransferase [Planctomycetota bacterium]
MMIDIKKKKKGPNGMAIRHEKSERSWQFGNMFLSLSSATQEDKEFCRRVHHAAYRDVVVRQFGAWDEPLQNMFFEKKWAPADLDMIQVNGKSAGCICRKVLPDHIWIEEIQLMPEFQERGIGSEIIKRQLNGAIRRGIPVRLQVLKANDRARELYKRLGFQLTGESEHHFLMEWRCNRGKDRDVAPDGRS